MVGIFAVSNSKENSFYNCPDGGIPIRSGQVGRPAYQQAGALAMHKVYAIKSLSKNYIYVGLTSNLEERLRRHNQGYEKTTRAYKPFVLLYEEVCENRVAARQREKYFKSGSGKEFLRSLL